MQPGDCIIAFGVRRLYTLRKQINKFFSKTGENKVAIVYGKLPPEVRKKQAQLFNEGVLPYLVSTDAIGMGLNLKIKKIVFSDLMKSENGVLTVIQPHVIRQIAGRAGRGLDHGYVQAMNLKQLKIIRRALLSVNKKQAINIEEDAEFMEK
jgi:ATP-dependent RNA helicase SUPV3L1/SUV3